MTVWNLGSVGAELQKLVPDIPTRISGTDMYGIIGRAIKYVEGYVNVGIGSVNINQTYHDAILYRSAINVVRSKDLEGSDVSNVRLGDFSIKKGGDSNSSEAIKGYSILLKEEMKILGRRVSYYKTY